MTSDNFYTVDMDIKLDVAPQSTKKSMSCSDILPYTNSKLDPETNKDWELSYSPNCSAILVTLASTTVRNFDVGMVSFPVIVKK